MSKNTTANTPQNINSVIVPCGMDKRTKDYIIFWKLIEVIVVSTRFAPITTTKTNIIS